MQNQATINQENISRHLCPSCGANAVFDPRNGQLTCPYCGFAQEIQAVGTIEERDYAAFFRNAAGNLQPMAREAMQVQCSSCGAIVIFTPPETARDCDFCGAKIVAQPKSADPTIAPEAVLPFKITDQQAVAALRSWFGSLWFAPSALKEFAQPDKIHSVYIPYWTYDSFAQSNYSGERGEHYYETEYYTETDSDGKQQQRSRQVRHTRWYSTSGQVQRQFDDVLIPATKSLTAKHLEELEPWDFEELKPYEPAYLAGHKAQTYQVALDEGFGRFQQIADNVIREDARQDIGGDEQRVHSVSTDFQNITFKHLLLPVYAGAYRFNNKVFQIVVNGRTGEVQGARPYSWIKITLFVLAILAVLLIIIMVVGAIQLIRK